jgi:hypothetical protein
LIRLSIGSPATRSIAGDSMLLLRAARKSQPRQDSGHRPPKGRDLSKAMDEATVYGNKLADDINQRDKKLIADAGKAKSQELSKDDLAAWQKAMAPVWKKFEGEIGKDLIDAAQKSNT